MCGKTVRIVRGSGQAFHATNKMKECRDCLLDYIHMKIVYVVVSEDEDIYLEQAWVSAYSLKLYNPEAYICFMVDEKTKKRIEDSCSNVLDIINELIFVETPVHMSQTAKSRYIKTSIRQNIKGDFLFIDTDTIITDSISEIDTFEPDIACVLDLNIPFEKHLSRNKLVSDIKENYNIDVTAEKVYFNTGVIYAKDTEKVHKFFETWHKQWKQSYEEKKIIFDQPVFLITDIAHGHIVEEMPNEFNYQILAGIRDFNSSKIIHFFNVPWHSGKSEIHPFFREETYMQVKEKGYMDQEIIDKIVHCKSVFDAPLFVIDSEQFKFFSMRAVQVLYNGLQEQKKWAGIFVFFLRVIGKIKRILGK